MSSMKQVVYAGAFGAVVTMQGCGGATDGETTAAVDATGSQSFEAQVHDLADDAQKTVQEAVEKFNADDALKKITDLATTHGVDVEHLKAEFKDASNMSSAEWSEKAGKAIETMQASLNKEEITDSLTQGFKALQEQVESIIKVVPIKTFSEEDAKKTLITNCKLTVKEFNKEKAIETVQAAASMQTFMTEGEHNANVAEAVKNCKAGFAATYLPCTGVKYNKGVSKKEMELKQNIGVTVAKGKAPAMKTILAVMPSNFNKNDDITAAAQYIVEQLNDIQVDSKKSIDFKGPIMSFIQGIAKTNAPLKKAPAKKAVVKGKKADEKAEKADDKKTETK